MSLDFCCSIQMVRSEFGANNMKAWIHPALCQWFCWWCNGVDIFLPHFGPLSSWALFKHRSFSIVADHVHPFMTTVYPTFCRIMHHVTMLKSSQLGFLNMPVSSQDLDDLHTHQMPIKKSIFGMWRNERFASWMFS